MIEPGGDRMRRKDGEKAQRIKEAVIQVVLEEGFSNASMSKIARCAGIPQATMYIYYENKETMLRSIYLDCAEDLWDTLLTATRGLHDGGQIIDSLIYGYYSYMTEHETLFRFVEQYASCPALTHNCGEIQGLEKMIAMIQQWEDDGLFKPYNAINIFSMIFNPVKMLTAGAINCRKSEADLLRELADMVERALLAP